MIIKVVRGTGKAREEIREIQEEMQDLQERIRKLGRLEKELLGLSYSEFLALRFLKNHPKSTMLAFASSTDLIKSSKEIKRLFGTLVKRGLIIWTSQVSTGGGNYEWKAEKMFYLESYGRAVLTRVYKFLEWRHRW